MIVVFEVLLPFGMSACFGIGCLVDLLFCGIAGFPICVLIRCDLILILLIC